MARAGLLDTRPTMTTEKRRKRRRESRGNANSVTRWQLPNAAMKGSEEEEGVVELRGAKLVGKGGAARRAERKEPTEGQWR
ncbi:hypothetical protein CRG98_041745 [Punica granatum]|uniref:Uncharacterized protein n=1 Tax=Punica granatum TaxID=22663 RepID=A0A2I0I214_PUNGR|nr:hypothetical protein CRG98_041745 [Punica granatum]